jgi:polysaccharide deacetylase 2 family uncharacterized protein YibQ
MQAVMEVIQEKGLFYLDSSSAPDSAAPALARKAEIPTAANHLFIDNIDDKGKVKENILRLGEVALEKNELVIFGHVRENTAQALVEAIPILEEMGVKLVFVSQLVK